MWPVAYRIPDWIPLAGEQAITTFGAAVVVAALAGGWLFSRRLSARTALARSRGWDLTLVALVAGLLGAKAYYLTLHGLVTAEALVARGGLVWYGGLAVGGAAVVWRGTAAGIRPAVLAAAAAPALALAYAIGRLGCLLVGADYGLPTSSFLGMSFPAGTPPTTATNLLDHFGVVAPATALDAAGLVRVHPTQLYEAGFSAALAAALIRWERSRPLPDWSLFGGYLAAAGAGRFAVEFLRLKDDRLLGPLTLAQLISLVLLAVGVSLLISARRQRLAVVTRAEEVAAC